LTITKTLATLVTIVVAYMTGGEEVKRYVSGD
jgi:hypothetical protein